MNNDNTGETGLCYEKQTLGVFVRASAINLLTNVNVIGRQIMFVGDRNTITKLINFSLSAALSMYRPTQNIIC